MWNLLISLVIIASAGFWLYNELYKLNSSSTSPEEKAKESPQVEKVREDINKALEKGNERWESLDQQ
jgi:hypothetical protein